MRNSQEITVLFRNLGIVGWVPVECAEIKCNLKAEPKNATVSCAADTQFRTATILLLAAASVSAAKRKLLVRLRVLYEFQYLCDFICISFNLQFDLSEIWTNLKFYFRCFANFSTLIEVGNTTATAAQCCCSTMRVCVWVCVSCVCVLLGAPGSSLRPLSTSLFAQCCSLPDTRNGAWGPV